MKNLIIGLLVILSIAVSAQQPPGTCLIADTNYDAAGNPLSGPILQSNNVGVVRLPNGLMSGQVINRYRTNGVCSFYSEPGSYTFFLGPYSIVGIVPTNSGPLTFAQIATNLASLVVVSGVSSVNGMTGAVVINTNGGGSSLPTDSTLSTNGGILSAAPMRTNQLFTGATNAATSLPLADTSVTNGLAPLASLASFGSSATNTFPFTFTPTNYGAYGDLLHDDSTALKAMVAAANLASNSVIDLQAGHYLLNDTLRLTNAGMTLKNGTFTTTSSKLSNGLVQVYSDQAALDHLNIGGPGLNWGTNTSFGVTVGSPTNIYMQQTKMSFVRITNFWQGIKLYGAVEMEIANCQVSGCASNDIYITNNASVYIHDSALNGAMPNFSGDFAGVGQGDSGTATNCIAIFVDNLVNRVHIEHNDINCVGQFLVAYSGSIDFQNNNLEGGCKTNGACIIIDGSSGMGLEGIIMNNCFLQNNIFIGINMRSIQLTNVAGNEWVIGPNLIPGSIIPPYEFTSSHPGLGSYGLPIILGDLNDGHPSLLWHVYPGDTPIAARTNYSGLITANGNQQNPMTGQFFNRYGSANAIQIGGTSSNDMSPNSTKFFDVTSTDFASSSSIGIIGGATYSQGDWRLNLGAGFFTGVSPDVIYFKLATNGIEQSINAWTMALPGVPGVTPGLIALTPQDFNTDGGTVTAGGFIGSGNTLTGTNQANSGNLQSGNTNGTAGMVPVFTGVGGAWKAQTPSGGVTPTFSSQFGYNGGSGTNITSLAGSLVTGNVAGDTNYAATNTAAQVEALTNVSMTIGGILTATSLAVTNPSFASLSVLNLNASGLGFDDIGYNFGGASYWGIFASSNLFQLDDFGNIPVLSFTNINHSATFGGSVYMPSNLTVMGPIISASGSNNFAGPANVAGNLSAGGISTGSGTISGNGSGLTNLQYTFLTGAVWLNTVTNPTTYNITGPARLYITNSSTVLLVANGTTNTLIGTGTVSFPEKVEIDQIGTNYISSY
jgi:hypothetical protein